MKKFLENKKTLFIILSYALSIASMAIVFSLLGRVLKEDLSSAAIFLGIALLCESGYNLILFVKYDDKKNRIRISVVALLFVLASIMGFVSITGNYVFFLVSAFIFIIACSINRFLSIGKGIEKKWNITNCLLGITFLLLSPAVFTDFSEKMSMIIVVLMALLLLMMAFKKLVLHSINFEKIKVLINILNVTHALDVLICLLALMIAFSFILPLFENDITNFWDALWYCFAVITTIGFGDFVAKTIMGRVLTVILGLFGIVVVAIITSVIVNFYNAVSDKKQEKEINKIVKDVINKDEDKDKVQKNPPKKKKVTKKEE